MRIGIITWFYYENYGTRLQALALQHYLRDLGHTAELINFVPPESRVKGYRPRQKLSEKIDSRILRRYRQKAARDFTAQIREKSEKLDASLRRLCLLSEPAEDDESFIRICNSYDLLICGSDQIWNPYWFHRYYYADFPEILTPKISYSPSIGIDVTDAAQADRIREAVGKFAALSVREKGSADWLSSLTGRPVACTADPVLLLRASEWDALLKLEDTAEEPYAAVYFLSDSRRHWRAAEKFCTGKGLKAVVIPAQGRSYYERGTIAADAGVEDFVRILRNAEYVITDSYHASLFSVIYEKQFRVFERFRPDSESSQNRRIDDFAEMLGLQSCLLRYGTDSLDFAEPIPYGKVRALKRAGIEESVQYLQKAVQCR